MPWTLVGNLTPGSAPDWVYAPPPDRLALPAVSVGENKLVGLFAVYPQEGANFVALSATGNYTVNWGDGLTENIATGVQANHLYVYSSISSATTTAEGFRQVVITITPQAGQTLTGINLGRKHTQAGLANGVGVGWVDIRMAGSSVSSLQLSSSTAGASTVAAPMLERFEYVGSSALTNIAYLFRSCYALRSIIGSYWTANVTNITSWLSGCGSLSALVDLNLSAATTGVGFSSMQALQRVSNVNLSSVASAASLFSTCSALQTVDNLNLSKATAANSLFDSCASLRTVSNIDLSLATDTSSAFTNCVGLQTVTGLTTPKVTNLASMFGGCAALRSVALFTTSQVTSVANMFSSCSALIAIPAFNLAAVTTALGFVGGCSSLVSVDVTGLKVNCNFSSLRLSPAALNTIYTNLGTAVSQTITVTGNYGTASDNPAIATAKGWTVTGS